jgi:hypothetical protein
VAADFASASSAPTCSANPLVCKIDFHCHAFPAEFFEAKEQTLSGTKTPAGRARTRLRAVVEHSAHCVESRPRGSKKLTVPGSMSKFSRSRRSTAVSTNTRVSCGALYKRHHAGQRTASKPWHIPFNNRGLGAELVGQSVGMRLGM